MGDEQLSVLLSEIGICFPSFFTVLAFDDTDDEDQGSAKPFAENVDELIQIWNGDSTLRSNSDAVGDFYARVADDWRNGGTWANSEVFTSTRYDDINLQVISQAYQSASLDLRADLDGLRSHLAGKVGLSLAQIFTGDLRKYASGGGLRGCTDCKQVSIGKPGGLRTAEKLRLSKVTRATP